MIEDRCDAELREQLGTEFQPGADIPKIALNPESWHLDDQALTVEFLDGMARHACGAPEVALPWTELKVYLRPGFPVPRKQ